MVSEEQSEMDACTTCNSKPSDRMTVTFRNPEKSVDVRLCADCHREFVADERVEVRGADD